MPIVKDLLYQEQLKNSVRLLGISFGNLDTEKKEPVFEKNNTTIWFLNSAYTTFLRCMNILHNVNNFCHGSF